MKEGERMKRKEQKEQDRINAKKEISSLLAELERREHPAELLDIIDVLQQVYQTIDQASEPEIVINHLVNYIRSQAIKGRLHFPKSQEEAIMNLGVIGQRAGWNSQYMANFSDKSQFYRFGQTVPRHHGLL